MGFSLRILGRWIRVPLQMIKVLKPPPPLSPAETEPTCIQSRICRHCSNDEESALPLEPSAAYTILQNSKGLLDEQHHDLEAEDHKESA